MFIYNVKCIWPLNMCLFCPTSRHVLVSTNRFFYMAFVGRSQTKQKKLNAIRTLSQTVVNLTQQWWVMLLWALPQNSIIYYLCARNPDVSIWCIYMKRHCSLDCDQLTCSMSRLMLNLYAPDKWLILAVPRVYVRLSTIIYT